MTDPNQANSTNQPPHQSRAKFKTAAVMEQTRPEQIGSDPLPAELDHTLTTDSQAVLNQLLHGPNGAFGGGSLENQTARLNDPRLQTAQHQALATQIGQVQGNRHLQRVVAAVKSETKMESVSSHTPKSSTGPAGGTVMKKSASPGRSTGARQAEVVGAVEMEGLEEGLGSSGPPTLAVGEPPDPPNQRGRSPVIQAKLTVNPPGDSYEQEADRVAETVMRMPDRPATEIISGQAESPPIQRMIPTNQAAWPQPSVTTEEEILQTQAQPGQTPEVTPELESSLQAIQGSGQPLPEVERTFFEPRFGRDFSQVRVHTDSQAVQLAQDLQARAFTVGRDIVFDAGQYAPGTTEGRQLLAHELTHVVQQGGGGHQISRQVEETLGLQDGTLEQATGQTLTPVIARMPSPATEVESRLGTPIIQRREGSSKSPTSPEEDAAFQGVVRQVKGVATQEQTHAPATLKSAEAQAAAQSPPKEIEGKAQANQVDEMGQQQPQPFDRAAFKQALLAKIAEITPKTLEEADEFKQSNKLDTVKQAVTTQVQQGKEQSEAPLEEKAKEAPSTSGIEPKPVTPLPSNEAGPPPAEVNAAEAAPKPKTEEEVSLQANSQELDQQMAEADVTEEQLQKSNEPEFQGALEAKKTAQADAEQAPQAYRQAEQSTLTQAQAQAANTTQAQTQAMHGERAQLLNQVGDLQGQTKTADEQKRAEVANHIDGIYKKTKENVEKRLEQLDKDVNKAFDEGAAAAKKATEDYIEQRMEAYKDERYSGVDGALLWAKDKLFGMPDEVNAFYQAGRDLYIAKMDVVLDGVATLVETGLTEAKLKIAEGKQEIQKYVASLDPSLRQVGQEAAQNIQNKFEQLEQSVNDKQNQLIDSLAQKYKEKLGEMDARLEEMKTANRGLVDEALDAMGGVIKTILELKNMLLGVLARAADAIDKIIKDPIGFLGNLITAVKSGLQNFVANIGTHLKKGLMSWLFGAMAEAGIQLPESFDLKGILSLVMQVLGLTYANIRSMAVKVLGEKVVGALEKAFEIFIILKDQGLGGLWEFIKDKLGDLKTMVIDGIKNMVITQVIQAGIQWLIGILGGPAGAFIKACKAIYDIVMWFVNNGSRLMSLVEAVLSSVAAIAAGNIGGAAKFIEESLARAIPVVIGFLASLLGLGNISEKIRGIIQKIREPINKAIGWVLEKAKAAAKKLGKMLGFGKDEEGVGDPEREQKVKAGLAAIEQEEQPYLEQGKIEREEAEKVAVKVKSQHPIFQSITVVDGGERWDYDYVIQRARKKGRDKEEEDPKKKEKEIQKCHTAIKILTQYERLAEKYKVAIPPKRLEELNRLRDAETITINHLPGTLHEKFPGEFSGMNLKGIRDHLKSLES